MLLHIASFKITFNKFIIIISLNYYNHYYKWASPMAQQVKNSPAMQETQEMWVQSNHSSILAWKIPWTEEPGGLQSMGLQRVRHN